MVVVERKKWVLRCICVLVIIVPLFTFFGMRRPVSPNAGVQLLDPSPSASTPQSSVKAPTSSANSFDSNIVVPVTSQHRKINISRNTLLSLDLTTEAPLLSKSLAGLTPRPPLLNATFAPLTSSDIRNLRTFVLFLGFGRTGHSIVGALLDAHPDIIIAHEYNVLKNVDEAFTSKPNLLLLLFNKLYANSHKSAVSGWRSRRKNKKGYSLGMQPEISWQGRFHTLKVIGDKSGGLTTKLHLIDSTRCGHFVEGLNKTLGVPVKGIHVVRNPYDTIATTLLIAESHFRGLARAKNSSHTANYSATALDAKIKNFFQLAYLANRTMSQCPISVHTVHLVDLIHQPRSVMKDLCEIVQVECHSDYLDLCEEKVFKTLSKTRNLVRWSQEQIEDVANIIKRFPEYSRYSFECDC